MTRVLFIPEIQEAPTSERSPALYRILDAMHDVLGLPATWDRFLYDTSLAKWPRYLLYPLDKLLLGLKGLLLALKRDVEVVWCETAHHALVGLVIARILGIRCVWDSHGNVKLFAESVGKGRLFTRLATSLETFVGKRVDTLVTVAEQDIEAYTQMGISRAKMHVIPTCVDLAEIDRESSHEDEGSLEAESTTALPVLLFFGNFKYEPNLDALNFIDGTLAPHLERKGIPCEIRIAGRDIPDLPLHPTVRVLGFVPNIYATIGSVDLCIVPIWKGQGVESAVLTKVLDVMAAGTPQVLSTFAARGIPGIEDGVHATVGTSEESFLQGVEEALDDLDALKTMAGRGRELIEREYDWEAQKPRIDRVVRGKAAGSGHETGT